MKKLLFMLLMLTSLTTFAQALEKSTHYKAEINTDAGDKYWYYFYVMSTGEVRQITAENTYKNFKTYDTVNNSNTTTYTWLNNGGVWSENQTFVFTKDVDSNKLYLHFMRVVQNEGDIPWSVTGVAVVEKYTVY